MTDLSILSCDKSWAEPWRNIVVDR